MKIWNSAWKSCSSGSAGTPIWKASTTSIRNSTRSSRTPADSPRLERILASSLELPASIFNSYAEPVDERTRRTHAQHREIISALKMRNPYWAEAAMSGHLFSLLVAADEA